MILFITISVIQIFVIRLIKIIFVLIYVGRHATNFLNTKHNHGYRKSIFFVKKLRSNQFGISQLWQCYYGGLDTKYFDIPEELELKQIDEEMNVLRKQYR